MVKSQGYNMNKTSIFVLTGLLGAVILSACNSASGSNLPTPALSATPQPTAETVSLPTPVSPNETAFYGNLQVTMTQAEITSSYLNEYGSNREPAAGMQLLWVHINLKNNGQETLDLPAPEHFSVLNGTSEYKPIYGHRQEHTDYLTLTTGLGEGQELEAWLRFDIPADLELNDLTFAFLPESSRVSVGFSSSDYAWADNPIYLWTCAP
jgi:hypothetical protein